MMKVAIYDTEHFETVYSLLQIWNTGNNQIHLFITPEVEQPLKEMLHNQIDGLTWIVKKENNIDYLRNMVRYIKKNKIELFIINTVTYHHLLLAWACKKISIPIILTVHDANTTFNPKIQLSARSLIRYIGKRVLIKNVSAFATLLSTTKTYLEKELVVNKPLYVFPGSIFIENELKPPGEIIKIVVPGTVDENRRDYGQVMHLIELLENRKIEIVLLGAGKSKAGKEIINALNKVHTENILIKTFSGTFVRPLVYDQYLAEADFILIPLIKTVFTNEKTKESYGSTKASGSFFDAVKFGKCIFVPDYIPIPVEFKDQCFPYKSISEVAEVIVETNPSIKNELKYKAWKNAFYFSAQAVRERLPFFKN